MINKHLKAFVAPACRPTQTKELKRLMLAVQVLEYRGNRMSVRRRKRIAKAALFASKATGVDAQLLVAVARMESDFIGLQDIPRSCYTKRTCWAGCGITQHYIVGPSKWVLRRCRRLVHNYQLAFLGSAKELAHHVRWCQKNSERHKPLRRCVLNRYNSGTYYRTPRRCRRRWTHCLKALPKTSWVNEAGIPKAAQVYRRAKYSRIIRKCRRNKYRCFRRADYWKTVLCFDYGARRGIRAKRSCRRMGRCTSRACRRRWGLSDIPSFYGRTPAAH